MKIKNIHGLDCVVSEGEAGGPAVILFHGYGANMQDLAPLASEWRVGKKETFYFPNGLKSLNFGWYESRAWYSIDEKALEESMRTGIPRDLSSYTPPDMPEALSVLKKWLTKLKEEHSSIIVGGFSQGAITAAHLASHHPDWFKAVILLSGSLMSVDQMGKTEASLPFIQSHGEQDAVLGMAGARALNQILLKLGWQGSFLSFAGGHEIPYPVVEKVKLFLQEQLHT